MFDLRTSAGEPCRLRLRIGGAVQGVGFRPFVYRLAQEHALVGYVSNDAAGVVIEVEGERSTLERFAAQIERQAPPHSQILSTQLEYLPAVGYTSFEIRHTPSGGAKSVLVLPDLATCPDCLRDIADPENRRYRYPFTNCTNCGPRFTIIESLPYDRPHTTMRHFQMCPDCEREYEDPLDRRFHAQPIACPTCGPRLYLWDRAGAVLAEGDAALNSAAEAIRAGKIVALKGLGGFQLLCDARNATAVSELRARKGRPAKPFAVMVPSLSALAGECVVTPLDGLLLRSPEAPILLLRRKAGASRLAPQVAPENPYLGVMLPYTPLHHLLMADLNFPVVATSGNLSDSPIITDEREALRALNNVADLFLVHDRVIAQHADDSVVRVVNGREMILRRARGYAPLPVNLAPLFPEGVPPLLAMGAHQKNTIAITVESKALISQHIGDLDSAEAAAVFERTVNHFVNLYDIQPAAIAVDLHPDYRSTQIGQRMAQNALPVIPIQHHYAHVLACMAEHGLTGEVLGVAWDGTGYGPDGTIWGGEFLHVTDSGYERVAHLRSFPLPGGEKAAREPRRAALGLLYALFHPDGPNGSYQKHDFPIYEAFTPQELPVLLTALARGINSPLTSSAGRLFDAVAAITGLSLRADYEGQAAMQLEFAADSAPTDAVYPFEVADGVLDWGPMIHALLADLRTGVRVGEMAAKFHNTLTEMIAAAARAVNVERVVLAGGVFQNKRLLESTFRRLAQDGRMPFYSRNVPPNDGGISLGQIVGAARELRRRKAGG